ncbi:hypothetical protein L2E82_44559 [Cichorium intybus]|uniref:Uncharacterized protein n=1 Tax=Cichorium intybus TaxID=13427 RepID=A0ACB8ZQF6_CICIN|nr:hypothetical protein L2E82_44559 [Cichorium intybus]
MFHSNLRDTVHRGKQEKNETLRIKRTEPTAMFMVESDGAYDVSGLVGNNSIMIVIDKPALRPNKNGDEMNVSRTSTHTGVDDICEIVALFPADGVGLNSDTQWRI